MISAHRVLRRWLVSSPVFEGALDGIEQEYAHDGSPAIVVCSTVRGQKRIQGVCPASWSQSDGKARISGGQYFRLVRKLRTGRYSSALQTTSSIPPKAAAIRAWFLHGGRHLGNSQARNSCYCQWGQTPCATGHQVLRWAEVLLARNLHRTSIASL